VVCPEIGAKRLVGGKARARALTKERRQEIRPQSRRSSVGQEAVTMDGLIGVPRCLQLRGVTGTETGGGARVGRGGVGEKPFEGFASTGPVPNQNVTSNPDVLATSKYNRWFLFGGQSPGITKEQRQEIARKAAAARWGKTK
jgi:hypothetical protein